MDKQKSFLGTACTFPLMAFPLMALLLIGCQSYHSADVYRANELGRVVQADPGIVLSVREVTLEPDNNYLGTAVGAVVGGVAGSYAGEGRGQAIGATVGTVVGGILGSKTQMLLERRQGWEILVRRDRDSKEFAVVQLSGKPLQAGQLIQILRLPSGRYRVAPRDATPQLEKRGASKSGQQNRSPAT